MSNVHYLSNEDKYKQPYDYTALPCLIIASEIDRLGMYKISNYILKANDNRQTVKRILAVMQALNNYKQRKTILNRSNTELIDKVIAVIHGELNTIFDSIL